MNCDSPIIPMIDKASYLSLADNEQVVAIMRAAVRYTYRFCYAFLPTQSDDQIYQLYLLLNDLPDNSDTFHLLDRRQLQAMIKCLVNYSSSAGLDNEYPHADQLVIDPDLTNAIILTAAIEAFLTSTST